MGKSIGRNAGAGRSSPALERAESLLAFALVGLLGLLVLPVSTRLLDVLIVANFGLALVILLLSISIRRAIDFSAFPTILLFVTLFRLALHVSSTRQLLVQGEAFDGMMIRSFGSTVAGDSPLIGLVVFTILSLIQYLIITRGSERVAEVAARFHLDAMPVRLMALDSAQSAGMSPEEAAERRLEIQLEADFYGAMDGASRYMRGENVASVLIVMINLAGGLAMGLSRSTTPLPELAATTALLAIGDGLVNLVPALVVSMTMGIVITKTARASRLSEDVVSQVLQEPRVLVLASAAMSLLLGCFAFGGGGFSPLALAGSVALATLAHRLAAAAERDAALASAEPVDVAPADPGDVALDLLNDPTLRLVVGPGMDALLAGTGASLASILVATRAEAAQELGLYVPEVPVALRPAMAPGDYSLYLRGVEIGGTEIPVGHLLDLGPGSSPVPGLPLRAFDPRPPGERDAHATWIPADRARRLPEGERRLLRPDQYVGAHLAQLVRDHADEILGLEELRVTLDRLRIHAPAAADEVGPGRVPASLLHAVLRLMLAEGVSIRNLPGIVQSLSAHHQRVGDDAETLLEPVRGALATQISRDLADAERVIAALVLEPALEASLLADLDANSGRLAIPPVTARALLDQLTQSAAKLRARKLRPVLAMHPRLRLHLRRLCAKYLPDLAVIAFGEVGRSYRLKACGRIGAARKAGSRGTPAAGAL
jgi:flagellar biosynthesis protein FlhA